MPQELKVAGLSKIKKGSPEETTIKRLRLKLALLVRQGLIDQITADDVAYRWELKLSDKPLMQIEIESAAGLEDAIPFFDEISPSKTSDVEFQARYQKDVQSLQLKGESEKFKQQLLKQEQEVQRIAVEEQGKRTLQAIAREPRLFPNRAEQLRSMRLSSSETDYDRERAGEAQAYDVWEQLRQGQLQQMQSPRSWIQKWMLEHTPNPFYGAKFGISDNAATLQNEREILASLEESRSWANAHPPAIPNSAYAAEIQNLDIQLEAARASMQQREESVAKAQAEMAAGGGVGSRLPPPATPPATPDWLSLLTGLKAGEQVKKTNVPTPSAQQWERLNPSQQQQFAGFLDWTKINFEDVLANMQRGRPQTPYGAGSSRFTPIRQR